HWRPGRPGPLCGRSTWFDRRSATGQPTGSRRRARRQRRPHRSDYRWQGDPGERYSCSRVGLSLTLITPVRTKNQASEPDTAFEELSPITPGNALPVDFDAIAPTLANF